MLVDPQPVGAVWTWTDGVCARQTTTVCFILLAENGKWSHFFQLLYIPVRTVLEQLLLSLFARMRAIGVFLRITFILREGDELQTTPSGSDTRKNHTYSSSHTTVSCCRGRANKYSAKNIPGKLVLKKQC